MCNESDLKYGKHLKFKGHALAQIYVILNEQELCLWNSLVILVMENFSKQDVYTIREKVNLFEGG